MIRDTARDSMSSNTSRDYFLVEGARGWTVSDQLMKKELILQGIGWGHMPKYLIEQELRDARLLPITGKYFKGGQAELVARPRAGQTPWPDRREALAVHRGGSGE